MNEKLKEKYIEARLKKFDLVDTVKQAFKNL